ncbi:MAG TPA: carboxyl transferase domain-containing protein, partial [Pyrinomonadaceae bacterium]|nr:carboxyl transferase domain-containing protein [Pyrinomonadaceae bacterium]
PEASNQPYDMRDAIHAVVDDGYFFEVQEHYAPNIVVGFARLGGRSVGVVANQPAYLAGVLDIDASVKGARFVRFCDCFNIPLVTFEDVPGFLPGVRQEHGGIIRHGAKLLYAFAEATVPKVTVITRKAYGGAYCVMASKHIRTDVNFAWPTAEIAVMGAEGAVGVLYRREIAEAEDQAAARRARVSGVAHFTADDDRHALRLTRELLSFIPSNNMEEAPRLKTSDPADRADERLNTLVPEASNQPYDIRDALHAVIDDGYFFEVQPDFAPNIVVGFARLDGRSVGLVANQPAYLAGVLDMDASVKAARFVRFCDCFNIPLVTFEDVPGFLPGIRQEHGGIIRHGAKLLYAFAEATVPKITVITRKAYGGAYCVMASKHIRTDINFAWPTAEIAVMGAEGAVGVLYRREIAEAEDREAARRARVSEFEEKFANPYVAAERGFVDEIIEPAQTRPKLIRALRLIENKRDTNPPTKHGNIPL